MLHRSFDESKNRDLIILDLFRLYLCAHEFPENCVKPLKFVIGNFAQKA